MFNFYKRTNYGMTIAGNNFLSNLITFCLIFGLYSVIILLLSIVSPWVLIHLGHIENLTRTFMVGVVANSCLFGVEFIYRSVTFKV